MAVLRRAGHDISFTPRARHNYTACRDALDPALTDLLQKCWFAQG
jgi:enterochelin esterase family protein